MRILFLCGGLEPGRDGVGDYTRRLAAECVRLGHECRIVSLNDQTAPGTEERDYVRCPAAAPWPARVEKARGVVQAFRPDWISLQFVPYGFQPKGMPRRLARGVKAIAGETPLQIMFHELWIGSADRARLKDRLVGTLQRFCIARLVRTLRPAAVHTSNPTYVALLRKIGVGARLLPLFGNIPVAAGGPGFPGELARAGIAAAERGAWWLGLFFGTLHPQWEPQPFLDILLSAARKAGRRAGLISVGRMGAAGGAIWEGMRREHGDKITFVDFGEQPGERISALMKLADFGVAASPWNLVGKSGSAAAMLDHGLPVIVTRGEEIAGIGPLADPLLFRCDGGLESRLVNGLPRREAMSRAPEVAARFLESLTLPAARRNAP